MAENFTDRQFKLQKVELLYRQSRLALVAVFINSFLYFVLSWNYVDRALVGAWYVAVLATIGVRAFLGFRWAAASSRPTIDEKQIDWWKSLFDGSVLASGCLWGAIAFFLRPNSPVEHQALTIFLLAGMSAAASGAYAVSASSLCAFLLPATVPLMLRLLFFPSPVFRSLGIVVGLYIVLTVRLAKEMSRHMGRALAWRLEKAAVQAERDAYEATSRAKTVFLARVSHELRTPLAAINGFAELLAGHAELPQAIRDQLLAILRNGKYLAILVNDLLDLSQIQAGRLATRKKWMSPAQEISSAMSLVQPMAEKKGLEVAVRYASQVPEQIYSDPDRFRQILANLLVNAVKFTSSGRVALDVAPVRFPPRLRVRVSDTGIGIPPHLRATLFEAFVRSEQAEVLREQGSGLGLALSRDLAHSLGGYLRLLESRLGQGSTFEFAVSSAPDAKAPKRPPRAKSGGKEASRSTGDGALRGNAILVVEHSRDPQQRRVRIAGHRALGPFLDRGQGAQPKCWLRRLSIKAVSGLNIAFAALLLWWR
jgi:signal transduction histidine kinase